MRYPDNFRQDIDPGSYAYYPKLATYEGPADDLKHLVGLFIPTVDIEKLVYVGERENVYVEMPDGTKQRPWLNVMVIEYDGAGKAVVDGYGGPAGEPTDPRAMATSDLASVGFTDASLAELAKEFLGETWVPDRPGPSMARREMYERVLAATFG